MKRLAIAAVKYLNTLPMLHGLQQSSYINQFDLHLEHPAKCAQMLRDGEVDIALCPVAALAELPEYHIVSKYGIGCRGPVRTVSVYSDRPLQELKAVRLYGESRSSNVLAQVLDQYYWKLGFEFIGPGESVPDVPTGHLVIGDACFDLETKFQHITDLGDEWYKFTGLPFLFACWVSTDPVDSKYRQILDSAFANGIATLSSIDLPPSQSHVNLHEYLRNNIRYEIDEETSKGMARFISYAEELNVSSPDVAQTASRQSI